MRGSSATTLLLLVLSLPSAHAERAESPEAARTRTFREQYEAAGRAYNNKEYQAAIPALLAAFALQPMPQILFNVAQAYRKLDQYSSARVYYELYLSIDKEPARDLLQSAQQYILEMKEREQESRKPQVIAVEKTKLLYVESEKPLPRFLRPLGIVSGVAGLGLLLAGATFLGLHGSCVTAAQPPALACDDIYNTRSPGTALTVLGAGALALGVVTFGLSWKRPPRPVIRPAPPIREAPRQEQLAPLPLILPAAPPDAEPPPTGYSPHDGREIKSLYRSL